MSSEVEMVTDRCARMWGMLWSSQMKLRLLIPETMIFCNGEYHSCLFTSKEHGGEVRKKSRPHTFDSIIDRFTKRADNDPSNLTNFLAVLVQTDQTTDLVQRQELPRVLRTLGSLPDHQRFENFGYNDPGSLDLYQAIKAYIHPFNGLRFVTTYQSRLGEVTQSGRRVPRDRHGRPPYSISTEVQRWTSRYNVDSSQADFYDHPHPHQTNHTPVPEAVFRECDRMALLIVDFMSRSHGVGIQYLQLEFVQSFTKRIFMHDIVDVVFLQDLLQAQAQEQQQQQQQQE
eukprot:CAMPEP_0175128684 /NCGR_PEP_ID=MMETSP0087-20121206/5064_1 /TAXON_ID=136419 /ORGANISM="Unknown Unknown, Strain D1" /LENGTH=285 /DNA_ID=CAMNT_0016410771 /DNA_START=33 /DNA_END=887 /DNA_ORIENTATION=+